ncbi:hypothetical protein ACIQNK_18810 [Streptomyces sp. NPDC091273]|uniref:hypothetical protein n=1 Tax=Streptomyces sp. NPDC091273 TaxID=3365982 RepID=UPI00380F8D2C
MFMHTLKRRMTALAAVLGLSVALPLTGATPAYAAAHLSVTKSHQGDFTRGGQGTYHFVIRNTGDTAPIDTVRVTDQFPQGLTVASIVGGTSVNGAFLTCEDFLDNPARLICDGTFPANSSVTIDLLFNVAPDAPCGVVTNTVTVSAPGDGILTSASDPTRITGDTCPTGTGTGTGGGGGGGSILPVDLNGVVTLFNNINTNNNLHSPGATNTTNQNLGINAP